MSGVDFLVRSLLTHLEIDPDTMIREFQARVATFEENVSILNANMQQINQRLKNIENHLGILPNGHGPGDHQITDQSVQAGNDIGENRTPT